MSVEQHFEATLEADLATRLELIDNGMPRANSRAGSTADVADLLSLAHQLSSMPLLEPDQDWMEASKRRMLARFEVARDGLASGPIDQRCAAGDTERLCL